MGWSKKSTFALILCAFAAGFIASWLVSISTREQRATTPEQGKEVTSVLSPDRAYRAKVWLPELGGLGATVSQPHQVWLENTKVSDESRLVFEADKTDGVRIKWNTPLELEICYSDAQIHRFNSRFVSVDRTSGVAEIRTTEVVLRKVKWLDDC
ncbi:MAG: hypothetical protein ACYC4D_10180 [Thermoleophilia bacterium]